MALNPEEKEFDLLGEFSEDFATIKIDHHITNRYVLKSLAGKKLSVTVKPFKESRTDAQNRYMHGVIVPTVKAWYKETHGVVLTADEVYTFLRIRVLGEKPKVRVIMGLEVVTMTGKRFSQMNKTEFAQAIDTIIDYFAQRGCYISPPIKNNHLHEILQQNVKDE